jgi:predicted transcriptional regulator
MSEPTVTLSVRVSQALRERLQEAAFRTKRSQAAIVAEALQRELDLREQIPSRVEMLALAKRAGLAGAEAMDDEELYDELVDMGVAAMIEERAAAADDTAGIPWENVKRELNL